MKLLSSLLVIGTTEALKCQVCEETFDTVGNSVGFGQTGCHDGSDKYEQECAKDDICSAEMQVDWTPRGDHLYKMKRSCRKKIPDSEKACVTTESEWSRFKDCIYQCEADNCNKDNDGIFNLTSAGGSSHSKTCQVCSYYQNTVDGVEIGDPECRNAVSGSKYSKTCPKYADSGCADAASYHKGYGQMDGEFEDFYRACTPFDLPISEASWSSCATTEIYDIKHLSCKSTCSDGNCNTQEHQIKAQCYACKGTRDGAGRKVGGDDRCWDNLQAEMLVECDIDHICHDELMIDWLPNGHYLRTIRRGCWAEADIGDAWQDGTFCTDMNGLHSQFSDCQKVCKGTACNNDMSVGDLFSVKPSGDVQQCQQCAFIEFEDGHREGLPSCLNSADPNRLVDCPSYADHGCYTATNTHLEGGKMFNQVERGCATFGIEDGVKPGLDCYDTDTHLDDEENFSVCKDYCFGDNCNAEQPTLPNQSQSAWPSCVTCSVYFDDEDKVLGIGNELDCRGEWVVPEILEGLGEYEMTPQAIAKYAQRCPHKGDYCMTNMEVDWLPRGDITYRITRGCSSRPEKARCTSESSTLVQYRDCEHSCLPLSDGNECNNDLEEISRRMNDGRRLVDKCVKCTYTESADGDVLGNPNCPNVPGLGDADLAPMIQECPSYARVACATATSFHKYYRGEDAEFTEDYRHCSPFDSFPETDCAFQTINNIEHINCKNTCHEDGCNTVRIERGNQCYACTGTVDAMGRPVGIGDANCWNDTFIESNPAAKSFLTDCRPEQQFCTTELVADWDPKGDQIYRIIRGCAEQPAKEICDGNSNSYLKFKDCKTSCENEGGPCNTDNSVFEKMSDDNVQNCVSCYWEQKDNGNVEGNRKCDGPVDASEFTTECPRYARQSCFTGASTHSDFGRDFRQIYKGCSSFAIDNENKTETDIISLPDDSGNVAKYSISKSTCDKDNCNLEHVEPEEINQGGNSLCQVCNVIVDQFNRTIGIGNKACWEGGAPEFQQDCGLGKFCSTDLEIDWLPRGQHQFRLIRGCTKNPPSYDEPCDERGSKNGKYKDCRVSCDPRVDGNSCNSDLDRVSEKFVSRVEMEQCYACEHYEDLDGNQYGNKKCAMLQSVPEYNAGFMFCPKYAHASCYTASSYHVDYNNPDAPIAGNSFEDYFRGCSPFTEHNGDSWGKHCERSTINGFEHENCKELCFGPKCNIKAEPPKPQCHTCSVTLDSSGNTIGTSDPSCMTDLTGSNANVLECAPNQKYCTDTMEIDWYGRGMQYVHFNRGCSREPSSGSCVDLTDIIGGTLKSKLCISESCEPINGPCNKDLSVADQFNPSSNGVKNCTTCSYTENDDGSVSGNTNCGESSTAEMSLECPHYQSTACFVASASHQQVGKDVYETYKGCSYFASSGVEKAEDIIGGVSYKTVKESCNSDNCNKDKYNKP